MCLKNDKIRQAAHIADLEAALAAVTDAARALVRHLADINLQRSNAKALSAALQYGPEVSALQDAMEGATVYAGPQEPSALRAVAEAARGYLSFDKIANYSKRVGDLLDALAALDAARGQEKGE